MQRYLVDLTRRADRDIQSISDYIAKESISGAGKWIDSMEQALLSLESIPAGNPIAPENEIFVDEIRHHLFGRGR